MGNFISEIKLAFLRGLDEVLGEALTEALRILQEEEGFADPNDTHIALCRLAYRHLVPDDDTIAAFFEGIDALLTQKETNNE